MADLTTDPADPRLTRGVDSAPAPQAEAYLVLSTEELAKGYVRPLRRSYVHSNPDSTLKPSGCGVKTTMSEKIAQTYARDPKFYQGTYCAGCKMHLANEQFTWDGTDDVVGS